MKLESPQQSQIVAIFILKYEKVRYHNGGCFPFFSIMFVYKNLQSSQVITATKKFFTYRVYIKYLKFQFWASASKHMNEQKESNSGMWKMHLILFSSVRSQCIEEAEVETNVYRPSALCYAHKSAHSSPSTTTEGGNIPKFTEMESEVTELARRHTCSKGATGFKQNSRPQRISSFYASLGD